MADDGGDFGESQWMDIGSEKPFYHSEITANTPQLLLLPLHHSLWVMIYTVCLLNDGVGAPNSINNPAVGGTRISPRYWGLSA